MMIFIFDCCQGNKLRNKLLTKGKNVFVYIRQYRNRVYIELNEIKLIMYILDIEFNRLFNNGI